MSSAAASPPKTAGARVVQAIVLVLLFAVLFGATRLMPHGSGRGALVAATGFLLVAGTLSSELVEVLRLPHLTGYLLAGIVAGPYVLKLVDHHTVQELTSINALALALIALEGGAELKLSILRQGLKSLVLSTLFQSLPILLLMAASSSRCAPSCPSSARSARARWWARASSGAPWPSPAARRRRWASSPRRARRARSPATTLTFVMTSDIVVVVLVAVTLMVARPLVEPTSTFSLHELSVLGHELFGSVALGGRPWASPSRPTSASSTGSSAWSWWPSASASPRCSATCASTRCSPSWWQASWCRTCRSRGRS